MSGNTFGNIFKVTTFGESHGGAIGGIIDGCPPGIKITEKEIQKELDRRKPGQSKITTPRKEDDAVKILSGIFEGKTLGTPISFIIWNKNTQAKDYKVLKNTYRPSHADFTYDMKYGIRNYLGGGRASARETAARVAAGAIAKKILKEYGDIEILSYVKKIHDVETMIDPLKISSRKIEKSIVRCPDTKISKEMLLHIENVKKEGDSLGGIIETIIKNTPVGLGEPVFDKLEAILAHAMMSIPASKAFEIGSGFEGTTMKGSEHNDLFIAKKGKIHTETNYSGGVQGGISNGEPIIFRVGFKPTATIYKEQKTVMKNKKNTTLKMGGRHDPCVLPRAVPIVEAMSALVVLDMLLLQKRNEK